MFQIVNPQIARAWHDGRVKPDRVRGVRRGARLIQLEIRRAGRADHAR